MQLSLQLSKLQGTTSYFDENVGRIGVKSDTVPLTGPHLPLPLSPPQVRRPLTLKSIRCDLVTEPRMIRTEHQHMSHVSSHPISY